MNNRLSNRFPSPFAKNDIFFPGIYDILIKTIILQENTKKAGVIYVGL